MITGERVPCMTYKKLLLSNLLNNPLYPRRLVLFSFMFVLALFLTDGMTDASQVVHNSVHFTLASQGKSRLIRASSLDRGNTKWGGSNGAPHLSKVTIPESEVESFRPLKFMNLPKRFTLQGTYLLPRHF